MTSRSIHSIRGPCVLGLSGVSSALLRCLTGNVSPRMRSNERRVLDQEEVPGQEIQGEGDAGAAAARPRRPLTASVKAKARQENAAAGDQQREEHGGQARERHGDAVSAAAEGDQGDRDGEPEHDGVPT